MNRPTVSDHTLPTGERAIFAGVGLVSMAVLILQIALTRLFSFTIWYHFAYVTISVALLGYGASGTLVAVRPAIVGRVPARRLALFAVACGAAIVVAFVAFAHVPFHPFEFIEAPVGQIPYMLAYYVAATLPFFFAGLCISIALTTMSQHVSRLYFFDLAGAGLGCLIVVWIISACSTPGAVIVAAVLVSFAGVVFAAGSGARAALLPALGTIAVALLGTVAFSRTEFQPSPDKFLATFLLDPAGIQLHSYQWSPVFRTDVFAFKNEDVSRRGSYAGWGISPHWKDRAPTRSAEVPLHHARRRRGRGDLQLRR